MRRVDTSIMDHSKHTGHHDHSNHEMLDNHGGMDMAAMGGSQPSCKMDMYWNWYTIDACFLSKNWHITSAGMFAGSCIGIVFLVVMVEGLRRLARDLDRYIVRDWKKRAAAAAAGVDVSVPSTSSSATSSTTAAGPVKLKPSACCESSGTDGVTEDDKKIETVKPNAIPTTPTGVQTRRSRPTTLLSRFCPYPTSRSSAVAIATPRPTFLQQLLKSFIYAALIGISYILMLLAMYYNGYIFFCLVIGAWLGNFLFGWDTCVLDESVAGAERGCGC